MKRPALPNPGPWQGFVSVLFILVVVLMATQYAVIKYGPAWVVLSPVGWHGPHQIGESPVPDEDVPPEAVQQGGVYLLDWAAYDAAAYKLDDGTVLPFAEGAVAALILLALPLLLSLRRRLLWPRWPLWMMCGLGLLSLLAADHFRAALMENAQWILVLLATFWLAGACLVELWQIRRLGLWLSALTVALVALAYFDLWRHVVLPSADAELPTYIRATCASRTAFGGLMLLLLPTAYAKVITAENTLLGVWWAMIFLAGACALTSAGAVSALVVAAVFIAAAKGWKPALASLVLVPLLVVAGGWLVSQRHLGQLADSLRFTEKAPDGTPYAVDKRWLETAAAYNGLLDSRYVLPPGAAEAEGGSAEVVGYRSNLVQGVGAGQNYQKSIGGYYRALDNPEKMEPDTYNLYLLLALQVGLFGALAWAWILCDGAALGRAAFRALDDPALRVWALGIAGSCVGLLVFSFFGTVLIRGTGPLLVTLLAVAARLAAAVEQPAPAPARPVANRTPPASSESATEPILEEPQ